MMRKGAPKPKPEHTVGHALANTKILSLGLAVKLGSIVVHADELTGLDGRELDRQVIRQALADPEVIQWVKDMGCLLPVKRIK
jgi:hypothetical protein